MDNLTITQIIPAPGWWAIHIEEDGTEARSPLVAWALLNNGEVVPLDADTTGDVGEVSEGNLARIEYQCP